MLFIILASTVENFKQITNILLLIDIKQQALLLKKLN